MLIKKVGETIPAILYVFMVTKTMNLVGLIDYKVSLESQKAIVTVNDSLINLYCYMSWLYTLNFSFTHKDVHVY